MIRVSDRRKKAEAGWESEGCWHISESCPGCYVQPSVAAVRGMCKSSKAVFCCLTPLASTEEAIFPL